MNKNLRNAIIVTILGVFVYLVTFGLLAYIFHQSIWKTDSLEDIFYIFLASTLMLYALGLLIAGTIGLVNHLKVKKVMITLIILTIYLSPIAMFGTFLYIDRQTYNATYSFSVERWANANEEERAHIIRFFREEYNLVGENIDVVPQLLGTPDSVTETAYYYNLGYDEYVLGIDPVYYLVEFNEQNIIIGEGVYQG